MRRLVICLMLVILLVLSSTIVVTAVNVPTLKEGILKYGDKSVDFGSYEFDDKANNFKIPGGIVGSGLYYKPQIMGDYIYLIGAIFIPRDVDFNDSGEYSNQQVRVGTVYTCMWRFKTTEKTLKPQLISHFVTRDSWTAPFTTDINEGNDDKSGTTKVQYAWGKGFLIPQLITSQYRKDTMYLMVEWTHDILKKNIYDVVYLTREQLESSTGGSQELFYVDYRVVRPTGGEPGAWGFQEIDKNTISVTSFPKNYKGDQLFWNLDISVPTKPKVISIRKVTLK